jgi:formylglycine-generating enzyme required for sulfatase activity
MQVEWWYASGGTRKGPISTDVLRQKLLNGSVTTSDLVWTEGMSEWTAVCNVPVLNKMIQALPPELPKTAVSRPSEPFVATEPSPLVAPATAPAFAGPWRRLCARLIDLWVIGLPTVFFVAFFLPPVWPGFAQWLQQPGADIALGFFVFPLVLVVEAIIFGLLGTTIGKGLLGIKVTTVAQKTPTFSQYLHRQFGVYFAGLGTGFPLAFWFTFARQYRRLKTGLPASYDEKKFVVTAEKISFFRYAAAAAAVALILVANSILHMMSTSSRKVNDKAVSRNGQGSANDVAVSQPNRTGSGVAAVAGPQPAQVFKDCLDCPEMVVIPAGSFMMGSSESNEEKPIHHVNLQAFALGKYEVTQGQWKAVMGNNPSSFSDCGDLCPVETVSWGDAQQFIQRLSQKTGKNYRLPSEAEWEYAGRAGSTTRYWWGETARREYANYGKNECCGGYAEGQDRWVNTAPVGQFAANPFGLHDMHGNVSEWVQDRFNYNYAGAPADGSAWITGNAPERGRLSRGGSWEAHPDWLRSSYRGATLNFDFASQTMREDKDRDSAPYPSTGFRLARTLP